MLRLREPFSRKVRLHIRQKLLQQLWDKYVPAASAEYERIQLIYLDEKGEQGTGQLSRVQLLVNFVLHNRMIQAGLAGSPMKTTAGQKFMVNNLRRLEKCFLTQLRCCDVTLYRTVSRTITLLRQAEEDGRRFRNWQKENRTIERQWKEYRLCSAFSSDMENFLTEYSIQTARTLQKELLLALTEREYGLLEEKIDDLAGPKEFMLQYIDVMEAEEIRQLWLQMEGLVRQDGGLDADFEDEQAASIFREKLSEVQKRYEQEVVRGFCERVFSIVNEKSYPMLDDVEKHLESDVRQMTSEMTDGLGGKSYQAIAELVNISEEKIYRLSEIIQMMEDVKHQLHEQRERIEQREAWAFETYRELYQKALGLDEVISKKDKTLRYRGIDSKRSMSQSREDIIRLVEERFQKQRQGEMSEEELKNICEYGRMFVKLLELVPEKASGEVLETVNQDEAVYSREITKNLAKLNMLLKELNQHIEAFSLEWRENDLQDVLKDQRSREMLEQFFEVSEDKRKEFIRNLADVIHIWYQVGAPLQFAKPEIVKEGLFPETTRLTDVSVQELLEWGEALLDADMVFLKEKNEPISEEKIIHIIEALKELSVSQGTKDEEKRDWKRTEKGPEGIEELQVYEDIPKEGPERLNQLELQPIRSLIRYVRSVNDEQYKILLMELSEVIRFQRMLSLGEGTDEEAKRSVTESGTQEFSLADRDKRVEASEKSLWEWAEALLFYPRIAASLDAAAISKAKGRESRIFLDDSEYDDASLTALAEDRAGEETQTEVIRREIEISKDRNNLRQLISQINHMLSVQMDTERNTLSAKADTGKISQLVYAEGQVETPMIQKLLRYIRTLDEKQYGILVKKLSQAIKVQSMLSLTDDLGKEAVGESDQINRAKRNVVSYQKLWEWGEALLLYPKFDALSDDLTISEVKSREESKISLDDRGNGDASLAENRVGETTQTEVMRRETELSKDRNRLSQLISQINHTLEEEADTERISQLVYAERQLEKPAIQKLLRYIQTLNEEQYGVLVKELSQVTRVQKELSLDDGFGEEAAKELKQKDRNRLRQLISQINRTLEEEADTGRISQLVYAESQLEKPAIQKLLRYIQTLSEEQYGVLVKELSQVTRVQKEMSLGGGFGEEAAKELKQKDMPKRAEVSEKSLWEWGEALLYVNEAPLSEEDRNREVPQTEVIRRETELSKDRSRLSQLISQINHTLEEEADTGRISQLVYAESQLEKPAIQNLLRYIQTLSEEQYGVLVKELSQVTRVQKEMSLGGGFGEEAAGELKQKDMPKRAEVSEKSLWEWGEALLYVNEAPLSEENRNRLSQLISQINRTLEEETDTGRISQLAYAESQLEKPVIQNLLRYIQTLSEEQYGALVKELSQVTRVQKEMSLGGGFGEGAAGELKQKDMPKRAEVSEKSLWEWGEALLYVNEAALSEEDRNCEVTQTEVIRREIELSKDRNRLGQLISQINHTLEAESDTEKLPQLVYAESQVETPIIQNLLHYIQTLDEGQYGELVKELSQVTKVQSSKVWKWGEALLDFPKQREPQKNLSGREAKVDSHIMKQRRMERQAPVLTYSELAQRILQYETGRRQTVGRDVRELQEFLNRRLTEADIVIPIDTSIFFDGASELARALPERKLRAFQIGYPIQELAYTVQKPDASTEEHQRVEMRLQEENSQIKSAQEQLGKKLTEVEKQLRTFEGAAKARQDARSFADQVKRQLYEELHVEKLRRGLI